MTAHDLLGRVANHPNPLVERRNRAILVDETIAGFETSAPRLARWDDGWAEAIMEARDAPHNSMGTLHVEHRFGGTPGPVCC